LKPLEDLFNASTFTSNKHCTMKNTIKNFRNFLLFGFISLASCNTSSNTDDNNANSDTATNSPNNTDTSMSANNPNATSGNADQETVNYLVTANTKEMAWLQAAINNKNSSSDVKSHARMMLKDHQQMGTDVSNLVSQKGWSVTPPDTAGVVNINDRTGKEWDRAWKDKMVADHTELLGRLTQAETSSTDSSLRMLVTKARPIVQKHLDMSKAMQSKQ
jgi:putative membrane protein